MPNGENGLTAVVWLATESPDPPKFYHDAPEPMHKDQVTCRYKALRREAPPTKIRAGDSPVCHHKPCGARLRFGGLQSISRPDILRLRRRESTRVGEWTWTYGRRIPRTSLQGRYPKLVEREIWMGDEGATTAVLPRKPELLSLSTINRSIAIALMRSSSMKAPTALHR